MIPLIYLAPIVFFGIFALDLGPDAEPIPTNHRLVYAALCLPWIVLALRTLRIGVLPGRDGLVIRNVMRTRRVPWADVERFELGDWGGFPCGVARLADGGKVVISALNPPFEFQKGQHPVVPRLLAELNEDLAAARGTGVIAPVTPEP